MQVDKNYTLIDTRPFSDIADLAKQVEEQLSTGAIQENVVIDLTVFDTLGLDDFLTFLNASNQHRAADKSFVLVSPQADLDELPDELVIVPTLQEAADIIEMEAIERDLGF